ncbi:hypothetical protein [Actinomadura sp. WMMB 499]|uniref:hypothetical protein n=1 Tax=Actinomadura sp. WMMB 499 TaxID=1219491 RepID=UPI00159D42EA|nr:hypothetical protein [Actinomadura sp. WMMB 499]
MKALLARIAAHGTGRPRTGQITFRDERGEVCTRACRSAAHRGRVATAVHRARF